MKKLNLLSRAEMKNVMGGNFELEFDGEAGGKCWKCCPKGHPDHSLCSVASGPGTEPKCEHGEPYEAKCK